MRLCIFSLPFHPNIGGLERIALLVAQGAANAGVAVEVVTVSKAISPADDSGFPFKITRTTSFKERLKAFRRADVILFMNISLYALPIAWFSRRPIVLSHHGIYHAPDLKNTVLGYIKRTLTRFFSNISVSEYVAKRIPGASAIVPNAYDSQQFVCNDGRLRSKDFVFCGRLVSDKGVDVLLAAFAEVSRVYSDANLTIVGDGPDRTKLESITKQLAIQPNVTFTGSLSGSSLADVLKSHACMVIPSLWEEPFGIVALEGIVCCETVISSCRGGLPEAVGKCGVVVEPTVTNLATAMLAIIKARRSGAFLPGQPTAELRAYHLAKHSPEAVTQQYLDVCLQAIGNK